MLDAKKRLNRSRSVWDVDAGGHKEVRWGFRYPHVRGNFEGEDGPVQDMLGYIWQSLY